MRRVALVLALLAAGCGASDPQPRATTTVAPAEEATAAPTETAEPVKTPTPKLRDPAPCRDVPDATCSTLRVPLDRSDPDSETLDLRVATAGKRNAPVFLMVSGGPGEAGVFLLESARRYLGPAVNQVRLV